MLAVGEFGEIKVVKRMDPEKEILKSRLKAFDNKLPEE